MSYPRDLVGYGPRPPHAEWPGGARLALQIVMNWEEGGERSILHGDEFAETYLHEVPGTRRAGSCTTRTRTTMICRPGWRSPAGRTSSSPTRSTTTT
jgi:hypothetical protein